jgi:peroxiredoxin
MDRTETGTQNSNAIFKMVTNKGENVGEISMRSPVLLVFLRHFGCAFCRAAMLELSKKRKKYEKLGIRLIFVHLSPSEEGDKYFERFQLSNCEHVSDENCEYYASFGLVKGNFNQLFGLSSLLKGFSYTFKKGHGWGMFIGDGFQMPGVFLIQEGEIRESFIHKTVSDQPDYDKIVSCCIVN